MNVFFIKTVNCKGNGTFLGANDDYVQNINGQNKYIKINW